jgi:hypothetical protein
MKCRLVDKTASVASLKDKTLALKIDIDVSSSFFQTFLHAPSSLQ